MLKSFKIRKLFNIYDYDIVLANTLPGQPEDIKFLTGPNGMGKSTILRLINSLYKGNYIYFLSVPFDSLEFEFDSCTVSFCQSIELPEQDEDSDLPVEDIVTRVKCNFITKGEKPVTEYAEWVLKDNRKGTVCENLTNMQMFFESEKCMYVSENRLHTEFDADDATIDIHYIKNTLISTQSKIAANFKSGSTMVTPTFNTERQKEVLQTLSLLRKCDIALPLSIEPYINGEKMEDGILLCCENAIKAAKTEIDCISAFVNILDGLMLLNKTYRLSPDYGLRFFGNDDNRQIIDFQKLSSGERHVICQFYTLLFRPVHYSLVLIDEPELSFHLMWQMQYLQTIINVQQVRKAAYLIATHSTHVFSGKFDITTDLYSQFKENSK